MHGAQPFQILVTASTLHADYDGPRAQRRGQVVADTRDG
jgi:hypothetical protein